MHSVLSNDIKIDHIVQMQRQYDEDMWELRLYVQNVFSYAN